MGGLLSLLDLGASTLQAGNAGVATAGRNLANVNTEGYTRETVDLRANPGPPFDAGVRVEGPLGSTDDMLALRERIAAGARGSADSLTSALTRLESELTPGNSTDLIHAIASLFGGILDLTSAPMDQALRSAVIGRGQAVATAFNTAAASIASSRSDSDGRIVDLAKEATSLASRIAQLNHALNTTRDPALYDERDLAAQKLSELVGGNARIDTDGKMRFLMSNGEVVVDGDRAATFTATVDPTNYAGFRRIDVVDGPHVRDVTTAVGGKMGGEIAFRDGTSAQAMTDLDNLANVLATQINTVHSASAGLDGVTGRNFFTPPAAVSGAARNLSMNATVVGNPSFVAAAQAGSGPADNRGALALIALRDQNLAGGGTRTFLEEGIHAIGAVGAAAASARDMRDFEASRGDVLRSVRDSVSGVSSEEELSRLAQFQHMHEAATRFISSINEMLDNVINRL